MLVRLAGACLVVLMLMAPGPAMAAVLLTFHSFNGSWVAGRFPHAFISMDGTLDATGQKVHENYGYTAVRITPAILEKDVDGTVRSEPEKYVTSTNRHFTVAISDDQYREVIAEMVRWRDAPGDDYSLDRHNCVHFVAAIARLVGVAADVPAKMVRRPKLWLNYVVGKNPQLKAKPIP